MVKIICLSLSFRGKFFPPVYGKCSAPLQPGGYSSKLEGSSCWKTPNFSLQIHIIDIIRNFIAVPYFLGDAAMLLDYTGSPCRGSWWLIGNSSEAGEHRLFAPPFQRRSRLMTLSETSVFFCVVLIISDDHVNRSWLFLFFAGYINNRWIDYWFCFLPCMQCRVSKIYCEDVATSYRQPSLSIFISCSLPCLIRSRALRCQMQSRWCSTTCKMRPKQVLNA